jgi:hypothetical protein
MQYEQGTENMGMTDNTSIPVIKPLTLADVPQIRRRRRILLFLTVISFVSI